MTVLINIFVCFQLLCGTGFTWLASSNGHVPDGAVRTGCLPTDEPLYVGRAAHNGSITPGKIIRSQGCLYFPYGLIEHHAQQYEVLVHNVTDQLAVAPNPVLHSMRAPLRLPERARLANRPVMERPLFDPITFGTRNRDLFGLNFDDIFLGHPQCGPFGTEQGSEYYIIYNIHTRLNLVAKPFLPKYIKQFMFVDSQMGEIYSRQCPARGRHSGR